MSEPSRPRTDFQRLLDALVDGQLVDQERAVFIDILRADSTARHRYCDVITLHTLLQAEHAQPLELRLEIGGTKARGNQADVRETWSSKPVSPVFTSAMPPPASIARLLSRIPSSLNRPLVWSIFVVGVLFAGYFVTISWDMLGKRLAQESGIRSQESGVSDLKSQISNPKSEIPNPKSEIESVATIRDTADVHWSSATDQLAVRNQKSEIASGEPLAITSGLVELQLKQGATLLIEGPAEWTIDEANRATLKHGRLVAKVPRQAIGFTVDTPTAQIVDLGTEFGVAADRDGETYVKVFVGKARIDTPNESGADLRSVTPLSVLLEAGDARRVTRNPTTQGVELQMVADQPPGTSKRPIRFSRSITAKKWPGLRRVEHGGTIGKNNLAQLPQAKAFAIDWLDGTTVGPHYPPHRIENLNDGRYGNQFSWLGKTGSPPFAGIAFGGEHTIASIAFGRDNGGDELTEKQDYNDFWEGLYTLQYTTVEHPDETTPDEKWLTLGTVEYRQDDPLVTSGFLQPMIRHRYAFPPVEATGVRILVPGPFRSKSPACIDEIEVYGDDHHKLP